MENNERTRDPRVYIVNFAGHDFSDAQRWGEIKKIVDGYVRLDHPDRILYEIAEVLTHSESKDWLLPSGLLLVNILAALAFYEKHGCARLLVYDRKRARNEGEPDYREIIITREQIQLLLDHFGEKFPMAS